MPRRRNPRLGYAKGLFEEKTPIFVPLEEVSEAQLLKLPRDAFSDDEWEELDEDIQAYIHEHDEASKERIAVIVDYFTGYYETVTDEENIETEADEYFSMHLAESAGYEMPIPVEITDEALERFESWDPQVVRDAIQEVAQDSDVYRSSVVEHSYYGSCESDSVYEYEAQINIYIELDDLVDDWKALFPDERQIAIEEIQRETSDAIDLERNPVRWDDRYPRYESYVDTGKVVCFYVDEDKFYDAIADQLEGVEPVIDVDRTPEERVFMTLPDGFYVQELMPYELKDESKALGICVGDPRYGYGTEIARGRIKILSLRTASGRSKLTFEVELGADAQPVRVVQIKGMSNRLPSKPAETRMAIAVVRKLGLDPADVNDLRPALGRGVHLRNPDEEHWHCGFCKQPKRSWR